MLGMSLFTSQGFHSLDFVVALSRGEVSTLGTVNHMVTPVYRTLLLGFLLCQTLVRLVSVDEGWTYERKISEQKGESE